MLKVDGTIKYWVEFIGLKVVMTEIVSLWEGVSKLTLHTEENKGDMYNHLIITFTLAGKEIDEGEEELLGRIFISKAEDLVDNLSVLFSSYIERIRYVNHLNTNIIIVDTEANESYNPKNYHATSLQVIAGVSQVSQSLDTSKINFLKKETAEALRRPIKRTNKAKVALSMYRSAFANRELVASFILLDNALSFIIGSSNQNVIDNYLVGVDNNVAKTKSNISKQRSSHSGSGKSKPKIVDSTKEIQSGRKLYTPDFEMRLLMPTTDLKYLSIGQILTAIYCVT